MALNATERALSVVKTDESVPLTGKSGSEGLKTEVNDKPRY